MSLLEAVTNVIIGFGVAVGVQMAIFPNFGLHASLREQLAIGGTFTTVSGARSFALRRLFDIIRMRAVTTKTAAALRSRGGGGKAADHPVMR